MFKPFYYFVGYRYSKISRKNHFISFISSASIIGIALGVMVLITVLSVMNGFSKEIRSKLLSATPHLSVKNYAGNLTNWEGIIESIKNAPDIKGVAPYSLGQGLVKSDYSSQGIFIRGILPEQINSVYPVADSLVEGSMDRLTPKSFGVIISRYLALNLNISLNEKITVFVPEAQISPAGVMPRMKRFKVVGIYETGHVYDKAQVFVNLKDADKLFKFNNTISGIEAKVNDEVQVHAATTYLMNKFQGKYLVTNWIDEHADFFDAIKMEKTVMNLILLLIVVVAAFNLISTLVIMVTEKQSDIGVLRAMGASKYDIMKIFMAQGTFIGCIGTFLGLILGLLLANNVTDIVDFLQNQFGYQLIAENVYFGVSHLPSLIKTSDVVQICCSALLISFLVTIYPALKAAKVQPAEALRYE